jgi:hypothetical protein
MIYQLYLAQINAWQDITQAQFEVLFEDDSAVVRAVVLYASNKNEEIKNGT